MFSSRNNNSSIGKSKLCTSTKSRCDVIGFDASQKFKNCCFKHEMNIKDKMQRSPNVTQFDIGSSKYECDDCSKEDKHIDNMTDRVIRQKNDSTELQYNDEHNIDSFRYKYKGRKSTSAKIGKHELRKASNKGSHKSSSTDDCVTRKSLIWLLHVQSKKQIHNKQSTDAEKNNTVLDLKEHGDNQQNVKKTNTVKKKTNRCKNSKHEGNNNKDIRNKRCTKIDNSRTIVNGVSSERKKYRNTRTSPITTDNSGTSSGNITNISQCKLESQQIIVKRDNNSSDQISAEEKESIKETLKNLKPSKYRRFHLILKKIERKITEDIEKKLRKVLKIPDIKTYFQNTLLSCIDEKKTISALMGAIMQILIILQSQGIERREKCYSGSKRDESIEHKQSAYYCVTEQPGIYDSKCSTNTKNGNSTSSNETYFTREDIKNKHLMKITKKHQDREANCKKERISRLKPQNDSIADNDSSNNDIDIRLSKTIKSCLLSEISKSRTVRKYKKRSFEKKSNFELQSMFKDRSSIITQNHKTYSADVITNSNTQFLNTKTNDLLCSKKDLKVLSLLNEIFNTPNITDDQLNKLSLAVLKNMDCCIEKEDIPYIIVEMNKLVKYSKDIYDQIYNIYKTVNTLKKDERNFILMRHLFSERKYNETALSIRDNKLPTVLNAEYSTYDIYKTETSDKCVGSETTNASLVSSAKQCQKSKLYSDVQETPLFHFNNTNITINNNEESAMLKSTQFVKDKMVDFTEMPVSLPLSREYLCVPEHLDKIPNKNENVQTLNTESAEPVPVKRAKNIYESSFRCGASKSNIQETETCSLKNQENNANMIHKTSHFYDVEMTDDSPNYSFEMCNVSEKNNEISTNTNCFIDSTNGEFSKNYKAEIFSNKKPDIGRKNSCEIISTTIKRKNVIDGENRTPKRQCIEEENSLSHYCVSQQTGINLARGKNLLSHNFQNRTVENVPYECDNTCISSSNDKVQNMNDSIKLQSDTSLYSRNKQENKCDELQSQKRSIYVPHVSKYLNFVDGVSSIHQTDPQFCYNMMPECKIKQNSLVKEQQGKYKTKFSNHKISIPYPIRFKNKTKATLRKQKNKLMSDAGFKHNYATFEKNEGFGDSCIPHHKIVRESNGIRVTVEDVDGKSSNDEELLQNVKRILTNTLKSITNETIYTDDSNSVEQITNDSFTTKKIHNFSSNNLGNVLYEPVQNRKIFEDSQNRSNSFICMKDNNILSKPQSFVTKIIQENQHFDKRPVPRKHNVLKNSLIESEAELCCVTNTSSNEATNTTHGWNNKNNLVQQNNRCNTYFVNSYANNPQYTPNYNEPTQFVLKSDKENTCLCETITKTKGQSDCSKTVLQKDSYQDLKCSDIPPESCGVGHVLDSNKESPSQLHKDSVKIYLKKDECIQITLNGHSHQNVSIQKLLKISETEFRKADNFMQPEILDHASISSESINSAKKLIVDSIKGKTKINQITPMKINTVHKISDFEKVCNKINSVNDQCCYNSKLALNKYSADKKIEKSPVEINEAQNINVYYCLADSQNPKRLFQPSVPTNPNKSSYIPFLHCNRNSSLNKNESNNGKNLFKYAHLPNNACVQKNGDYNRKQEQIPKQSSVEPQLPDNRSEKSPFYDSSQFDPVDSRHMESRKKNKKGLRKISWHNLFSKLFIGKRLKSNDN